MLQPYAPAARTSALRRASLPCAQSPAISDFVQFMGAHAGDVLVMRCEAPRDFTLNVQWQECRTSVTISMTVYGRMNVPGESCCAWVVWLRARLRPAHLTRHAPCCCTVAVHAFFPPPGESFTLCHVDSRGRKHQAFDIRMGREASRDVRAFSVRCLMHARAASLPRVRCPPVQGVR